VIAAGVAQVRLETNLSPVVVCEAEAARYWLSVAQLAVTVQVPEPDVIVTVAPLLIEQEPVAVITAFVLAFVVAVTVKVDWYGAVTGAPVNVTVAAPLEAVVDSVIFGAAV
jgi:hypothetical protein